VARGGLSTTPAAQMTQGSGRGFAAIEIWVFDLDNTLYPHHLNLWQQVDARIRDYIVDFLKVTHQEAVRVQKDYYRRYGTTMRGLMEEHGLDPEKFLEVVHEIDHSPLTPNPALGAAIAGLPGRKLILTNGTRRHADAVMRRLEIEKHFEDVFDIVAGELEPKPLRGVVIWIDEFAGYFGQRLDALGEYLDRKHGKKPGHPGAKTSK